MKPEPTFPLVTVAMVTYNSAKYVEFAMRSVLASSYENIELIICDDRSSDGTWEIVMKHQDPRIRAFQNEANLGEYPNRNKCIDLANGKYFIFIDGDDMIYPHGLEFMVRMLNSYPQCAFASCFKAFNNIFYPLIVSPKEFFVSHFLGTSFLACAFTNVLFKTSILKQMGGLSEKYPNGDDYIRLKIAQENYILIINDGCSWWRETPNQASKMLSGKVEAFILYQKMLKEFLLSSKCPLLTEEKRDAKFNLDKGVMRKMLQLLLKGKVKDVYKLSELLYFQSSYISVFKKRKRYYPFCSYTPANPYQLNLMNNPFTPKPKIERGN